MYSSSFRVLHKSADSVGPAVCAFPARAAQAARSLSRALSPGAVRLLPSVVPASVSGRAGLVGLVSVLGSWSLAATSRQMSAIQNLRKSLVRNWEPVCSLVGGAISGAEFAPFPSPLPPASGGDGPVCSRLAPPDLLSPFVLRAASSVFRQVNFLSLFCYPTV